MNKTIYDIASENNFKVFAAKPQKHGGEYSYLRIYSQTWPYIVLTYQGMTIIVSERTGVQKRSLYDSEPEIFSESIDKKIPANKIVQAAKAFADADNIMAELKEFDPELPAWKEYEEPGDR
mgnify:CR=1 FL=1